MLCFKHLTAYRRFCSEIMEKHSLAQELYGYQGRQVLPDMFCESQ
jgi:hypothetical protein